MRQRDRARREAAQVAGIRMCMSCKIAIPRRRKMSECGTKDKFLTMSKLSKVTERADVSSSYSETQQERSLLGSRVRVTPKDFQHISS